MARSIPAHVTPDVLRWARESLGYTAEDSAHHLDVFTWEIEAAESGDVELTLRQAERLAKLYDRSLAELFLPEPPPEETQEALFRRLPGAPDLPWPPAMRRLARHVRDRQDAAAEIYELRELVPTWHTTAALSASDDMDLPQRVREMLGLSLQEQLSWDDPQGYLPLRSWIDALEARGILVMQDGTLELDEMRGFASLHDDVPVIVINTRDDPRARVFTILHELGHLLRPAASETWCNQFAATVLMPEDVFRVLWEELLDSEGSLITNAATIARRFGVTPYAAAVRAARLGLIPDRQVEAVLRAVRSHTPRRSGGGGDHYRNKVTWLGPGFISLVLDAVADQAVSMSSAAGLLEAKVDHFSGLRKVIEDRAQLV